MLYCRTQLLLERTGVMAKTARRSHSNAVPHSRSSRPTDAPAWEGLSDSELLELRISDLGLRLRQNPLQDRIERLYGELRGKGLRFRPHCWLSDDWFAPDGVPGIAIPFYLAHPRLKRLERRMMLRVEGGDEAWCMRILRHEAGHAIDTAYRLANRPRWRRVFGDPRRPYPTSYQPRARSRNYVLHLESWYAQSHPAEDFAETFAVWLKPRSAWKQRYRNWPALRKLEYVDELMHSLGETKQQVANRETMDPVRKLRITLRDHYAARRQRYGVGREFNSEYDGSLLRLFHRGSNGAATHASAARLFRQLRGELPDCSELLDIDGFCEAQLVYAAQQVLAEMAERCEALDLRWCGSERAIRRQALQLISRRAKQCLQRPKQRAVTL